MLAVLNKSNIEFAHNKAKNCDSFDFNCWGATLFVLDKIKKLKWSTQYSMLKFLNSETEIIDTENLKAGDILVLWKNKKEYNDLIHTAVYIEAGKFWHKVGSGNSSYAELEEVLEVYEQYSDSHEIRRVKNNG